MQENETDFDFRKLTEKQRIFCHEYVFHWNASKAARNAGYSLSTSHAMGAENLTKPLIKAYISHIQIDLAKLAGVSALRNLTELSKIAYSNIADYKDGWMTEKKFDKLTEVEKAALSEIQYTQRESEFGTEKIVKFKLHDKMKAISMINKMCGFDTAKKLELSGSVALQPVTGMVVK